MSAHPAALALVMGMLACTRRAPELRADRESVAPAPATHGIAHSAGRLAADDVHAYWTAPAPGSDHTDVFAADWRGGEDAAAGEQVLLALPGEVTADLALDATTLFVARDGTTLPCTGGLMCGHPQASDGELLAVSRSGATRVLFGGFTRATALAIDGDSVFLATTDRGLLRIAKHAGAPVTLLPDVHASSLLLDGDDVYVVGPTTVRISKGGGAPATLGAVTGRLTLGADGALFGIIRTVGAIRYDEPNPFSGDPVGGYYQIKGPPGVYYAEDSVGVLARTGVIQVLFPLAKGDIWDARDRPLGLAVSLDDELFFDDRGAVRRFPRDGETLLYVTVGDVTGLAVTRTRVLTVRQGQLRSVPRV